MGPIGISASFTTLAVPGLVAGASSKHLPSITQFYGTTQDLDPRTDAFLNRRQAQMPDTVRGAPLLKVNMLMGVEPPDTSLLRSGSDESSGLATMNAGASSAPDSGFKHPTGPSQKIEAITGTNDVNGNGAGSSGVENHHEIVRGLLDRFAGISPRTRSERKKGEIVDILDKLSSPDYIDSARQALNREDLTDDHLNALDQVLKLEGRGELVVRPLKKILIANRGEIAVNVLRAIEEENAELPASEQIIPVTVYPEWDKDSLHVRKVKEAGGETYPITSAEHYLDGQEIIEIARRVGADSIHPGYGYLSEDADFSEAVRNAGIAFIGPPPEASRLAGEKDQSKARFEEAGIPIIRGTKQGTEDVEELIHRLKEAGLVKEVDGEDVLVVPIQLKATAAGGGKAQATVETIAELRAAHPRLVMEAKKGFKKGEIIGEVYIEFFVHLEVQILADRFGNVIHLGTRECTLQERHQKLIEFFESVLFPRFPWLRGQITSAGVRAGQALAYVGAGTVEFLVNPETGDFFAMELNARIQVERTVTEMVTGVNIVREQFRIARGLPLSLRQDEVRFRGQAVEVRLKAVDPDRRMKDGTPVVTPGPIQRFIVMGREGDSIRELEKEGIRVDSSVETSEDSGDEISTKGDPMFVKVSAWVDDEDPNTGEKLDRRQVRSDLVDKMIGVLEGIVVERWRKNPKGEREEIATDLPRQRALMKTRIVREGFYDSRLVGEWEQRGRTEDLTRYPFVEEDLRYLWGGGNILTRVVGLEPIPEKQLAELSAALFSLVGEEGGVDLKLAGWAKDFLQSESAKPFLLEKPQSGHHYTCVVDAEEQLQSWTLWDAERRPVRIFLPLEGEFTFIENSEDGFITSKTNRMIVAFEPDGEAWQVRRWLAIEDAESGQVNYRLYDEEEAVKPTPIEGQVYFTFSQKHILKVHVSQEEHGAERIMQEVEIRDLEGNTLFRAQPTEVSAEPWERLPYYMAGWDRDDKTIPEPILRDLQSIVESPEEDRILDLESLSHRPEALKLALYRLERHFITDDSPSGRQLLRFCMELLARRSLLDAEVSDVVRDEQRSMLAIRFSSWDDQIQENRECRLVRLMSPSVNQLSTALIFAGKMLSEQQGPDAEDSVLIIEANLFTVKPLDNPDKISKKIIDQIKVAHAASQVFETLSRITVYVDDGSEVRMPMHFVWEEGTFVEDKSRRGVDQTHARTHERWKWDKNFDLERQVESDAHHQISVAQSKRVGPDRRLLGEVSPPVVRVERDPHDGTVSLPELERAFVNILTKIESAQERLGADSPSWNRLSLAIGDPMALSLYEAQSFVQRLCEKYADRLSACYIREVVVKGRVQGLNEPDSERRIRLIALQSGFGFQVRSESRIFVPIEEKEEIKETMAWVNDNVYKKWLRKRKRLQTFYLQEGEYTLDRSIQSMSRVEQDKAQLLRRGFLRWNIAAESIVALKEEVDNGEGLSLSLTQRPIFARVGLPVLRGTGPGITEFEDLLRQLISERLAQFKEEEDRDADFETVMTWFKDEEEGEIAWGKNVHLNGPVWFMASGFESMPIDSIDELEGVFEAFKKWGLADEMRVEQYVPTAQFVTAQFVAEPSGDGVNFKEAPLFIADKRESDPLSLYSPSLEWSDQLEENLIEATRVAAQATNHEGPGHVKFLIDPKSGKFYVLKIKAGYEEEQRTTEPTSDPETEPPVQPEPSDPDPQATPSYHATDHPVPPSIVEWLEENGITPRKLPRTLKEALRVGLKMRKHKRRAFKNYLAEIADDIEDGLKELIQSPEKGKEEVRIKEFAVEILVAHVDAGLDAAATRYKAEKSKPEKSKKPDEE